MRIGSLIAIKKVQKAWYLETGELLRKCEILEQIVTPSKKEYIPRVVIICGHWRLDSAIYDLTLPPKLMEIKDKKNYFQCLQYQNNCRDFCRITNKETSIFRVVDFEYTKKGSLILWKVVTVKDLEEESEPYKNSIRWLTLLNEQEKMQKELWKNKFFQENRELRASLSLRKTELNTARRERSEIAKELKELQNQKVIVKKADHYFMLESVEFPLDNLQDFYGEQEFALTRQEWENLRAFDGQQKTITLFSFGVEQDSRLVNVSVYKDNEAKAFVCRLYENDGISEEVNDIEESYDEEDYDG